MALSVMAGSVKNKETTTVTFPSQVLSATAVMTGFDVGYSGTDHHIQEMEVEVNTTNVSGNSVTVSCTCAVHDHSNNWAYGTVYFAVIANLS